MKKIRFIRAGWMLLLAALVLGVSFLTPALASTVIADSVMGDASGSGTIFTSSAPAGTSGRPQW